MIHLFKGYQPYDFDRLVSLERCHFFFLYTLQVEQMVSGCNMLSLGGPVFANMKRGKKKKEKTGRGRVDGILRVLAPINSLTFCPDCYVTDTDKRMQQGKKRQSLSISWSSICESTQSINTNVV